MFIDMTVPLAKKISRAFLGIFIKSFFQVQFLITQLIISTHFNVSTAIGDLFQKLNVQWSLVARWTGEQTVPHVT